MIPRAAEDKKGPDRKKRHDLKFKGVRSKIRVIANDRGNGFDPGKPRVMRHSQDRHEQSLPSNICSPITSTHSSHFTDLTSRIVPMINNCLRARRNFTEATSRAFFSIYYPPERGIFAVSLSAVSSYRAPCYIFCQTNSENQRQLQIAVLNGRKIK